MADYELECPLTMTDEDFLRWLPKILTIGVAIRKLRERQHITQLELAEECGLSEAYVCRIESGERHLNRDLLLIVLLRGLSLTRFQVDQLLLLAEFSPLRSNNKPARLVPLDKSA